MGTQTNSSNASLAVHIPSPRHLGHVLRFATSSQHDWRRSAFPNIRSLCSLLHCKLRLRISGVQWERWLHGRTVFAQHCGDAWILDIYGHILESRDELRTKGVEKEDQGQVGSVRSSAWVRDECDDN